MLCFTSFQFQSPTRLNHRNGSQNLTYLSTYPLQIFKKLALVYQKQAANKARLHHIQGGKLLLQTEGSEGTIVPKREEGVNAQRSPGGLASNLCLWLRDTYRTLSSMAVPVFSQTRVLYKCNHVKS